MIIVRSTNRVSKSKKYLKRWRGKDGKYQYKYADGGPGTSKEIKKGTKYIIDMGKGTERVTIAKTFKGDHKSPSGLQFVHVYRWDSGYPNEISTIELSAFKDAVKQSEKPLKKSIIVQSDGAEECHKLAEKHGVSVEHIRKQLDIGKAVEMKHADRQFEARRIALGHLEKDPNYYSTVEKVSKSILVKAIEKTKTLMRKQKIIMSPPAEYDHKYKLKGRVQWHGLNIAIENKKGSCRKGKDPNGKPWKTYMNFDYGRIGGTKAVDNEGVDCVAPDTRILMSDYTEKIALDIKIGDILVGSEEYPQGKGNQRKQKPTTVTAIKTGKSKMVRIVLDDGSEISTTKNHLHSYLRTRDQRWKRADELKYGDILTQLYQSKEEKENRDYMIGYLFGAYLGDGCVRLIAPEGKVVYCDITKGIDGAAVIYRVKKYWNEIGLETPDVLIRKPIQTTAPIDETGRIVISTKKMAKLNIRGKYKVAKAGEYVTKENFDNYDWCRGFMSGFYDTDGHLTGGWGLTIGQVKKQRKAFDMVHKALDKIGFKASEFKKSPEIRVSSKKWKGSDVAPLSFVMRVKPSTQYKRDFMGISLRFQHRKIVKIEEYYGDFVAIETDLGTYVANGFFTHNCYIGPDDTSDMVYVVHQQDPFTRRYDEDKAMCQFPSRESAIEGYLSQYDRPDFLGPVSEFTIEEFKEVLKEKRGTMLYRSDNAYRVEKAIKDLDYWKKKLIEVLNGDMKKARGYPVGTVRTWSGKEYKKVPGGEDGKGKWMRNYTGKDDKGERQAVRNVTKKIQNASSMAELLQIVRQNKERFIGEDGKALPIVKEFLAVARGTEAGTKKPKEETQTKPQPEKEDTEIDKIKKAYNKGDKVSGDTDSIYVGNEELEGQWKLVEADSPTASHDETNFNRTEGFPTNKDGSTINDRDYGTDKSAQEIVNSIASNFDGRALSFDSPVVVTQDGVVISGNNRTMSSKIAARKGTDKEYLKALNKRAKKFGFSSDDMSKFKNPRVVFEVQNKDYSTEQFAKFNVKETKQMSPVESAVKMSKIMTTEIVKNVSDKIYEFDTLSEMYADKKATTEIFNSLQGGKIITEFNRPQYITEDGVTGAGKEFLETVMIGSVVNEKNIRGLNKAKAVRKKLVKAISHLVQNKSMGGYSISDEMNQAIDVVLQVKASGDKFKTVDDFAKQSNMFEEKNNVAIELAKKLELKERDFADFMQKMNANLGEGASGQTDIFFGEVESKEGVLKRMLGLLNKSIFQGQRDTMAMRKSRIIVRDMRKAKRMPIGTESKGRKKVAEGKWVPIKSGERSKTEDKKSGEAKTFSEFSLAQQKGIRELVAHADDYMYSVKRNSELRKILKKVNEMGAAYPSVRALKADITPGKRKSSTLDRKVSGNLFKGSTWGEFIDKAPYFLSKYSKPIVIETPEGSLAVGKKNISEISSLFKKYPEATISIVARNYRGIEERTKIPKQITDVFVDRIRYPKK